ncbi:unnamed protein product [Cyclocybe aegerita]|uniref:Major facilitator superfamily (MFS) profile domain-containing protein n=1 Tax=Cyclocybe aegerita TaxID=1973307 RepID=A0A8S0WNQ1_CYCAE|nr:unnamed protein product [Cyclocybe aegerita]
MLSMLLFGLSRTLVTLILSRAFCGLLNGNIGVMKTALGELTDATNRAEAFALMPAVWAFGATMGPLLGGSLSRPADRFPVVFASNFWKKFPYFLPCVATASYVFAVLLITGLFFEETVQCGKASSCSPCSSSSSYKLLVVNSDEELDPAERPVSFRGLFTFPVVISIANYAALGFLSTSVNALLPLFFHTPIELGGLNLDPARIGYIMGVYGAGMGLFQMLFFAKIVRRWGTRRVFIVSMATFVPVFMLFPVASLIAKRWGLGWGLWVAVGLILFLLFIMDTAFGCIFMYVTESAPNRRSLGATNGLAQTTVSSARAVGPALTTSLFSFSVQKNLLHGHGVYVVLAIFSCGAVYLGTLLPHRIWSKQVGSEDASDSEY